MPPLLFASSYALSSNIEACRALSRSVLKKEKTPPFVVSALPNKCGGSKDVQ
jgi:hypothetical protein